MDFDFTGYKFYLYPGACDMRKGLWCFFATVERMGLDIHEKAGIRSARMTEASIPL